MILAVNQLSFAMEPGKRVLARQLVGLDEQMLVHHFCVLNSHNMAPSRLLPFGSMANCRLLLGNRVLCTRMTQHNRALCNW